MPDEKKIFLVILYNIICLSRRVLFQGGMEGLMKIPLSIKYSKNVSSCITLISRAATPSPFPLEYAPDK